MTSTVNKYGYTQDELKNGIKIKIGDEEMVGIPITWESPTWLQDKIKEHIKKNGELQKTKKSAKK